MASGTVYEPYISDYDENLCSSSLLNSEQIDICFTNIGLVLFKITHFEILNIFGVHCNRSSVKFCRSSLKLYLLLQ